MAIKYSGQEVNLREVVLREMPQSLLDLSSKGTVPVLVLKNGDTIDESLDIMYWALSNHDPDTWLKPDQKIEAAQLIANNDNDFKYCLDRYKYSDRYPENSTEFYREKCQLFMKALESRLSKTTYLLSDRISIADIAIFPFIRQLAFVDKTWFDDTTYSHLKIWLEDLLGSELFTTIMEKYPQWHPGDDPALF